MNEELCRSNSYCHHMKDKKSLRRICGGMIHADSMEDAARRLMKRDGVRGVIREHGHRPDGSGSWKHVHLMRGDQEVYMYISVHPENFMDESELETA